MGRREEREEIQSTWMVMREPPNRDGTRRERRARLVEVRRQGRSGRLLRVGTRVAYRGHINDLGTIVSGPNPDGSWNVKWDNPDSSITSNPPRLLMRVEEQHA